MPEKPKKQLSQVYVRQVCEEIWAFPALLMFCFVAAFCFDEEIARKIAGKKNIPPASEKNCSNQGLLSKFFYPA